MRPTILIVDDEPGVRSSLAGVLRDEGYAVEAVESGEACLERITRGSFEVVLLDVWLPGIDGLTTLARLRERRADSEVVMISGHGNIESAVRAIKMGAFDFVEKPLSLEKTVLVVRNALRQRRLEVENRALRARVDRELVMVGESYAMHQLREQVAMAAPTNGRVLIYGENGTGKELVARTIHTTSKRRTGPFVEVNCAAIPEELIESELFGHVRGAFTGAIADRRGKFELADGGTLFLDEIGDMSLKTQAKVLRVLQEQVVQPVGGASSVRTDVRVLVATNKDLPAEIRAGRFREDLYFRLNVIPIFVPPLRDRQEDIPLLADHFMAEFAREYGRRLKTFDETAVSRLQHAWWPGNVRELRNVIERLIIMVPGDRITARDLLFLDGGLAIDSETSGAPIELVTLQEARNRFERDFILRALASQQGNISRTAEALGVERSNLYRKMRSLGIAPARQAEREGEEV
ncbi:MAG: sigma-54-dependent Fis family transcriptional regulator [Acidobacteria bacterium]|nr:sigma-54-dependent Fis family transcriptional regulator [Acidobacteriota bacterium]MBI3264738.1 sigma-54-dependent Fis family transcriptional regulator [Acidobacteriota bacterium]